MEMTLALEGGRLILPKRLLKKLKGRRVKVLETEEGILLKPVEDTIKEARGILKGSKFNSETLRRQKQIDKELES
jgi:bifunctional DNA-binding transcriptional regulator/antitoxin component of YhaV-PrlF toxin-antitoxin module